MNLPGDQKEAQKVTQAWRAIAGASPEAFKVVKAWIESELNERDKENRVTGFENKEGAAQCLADFVGIVTASLAPVADRDESGTGAEGMSDRNLM